MKTLSEKTFLILLFVLFLASSCARVDKNTLISDIEDQEDQLDDAFYDDPFMEDEDSLGTYDPLEPMNRIFFTFNDRLYVYVLTPVKRGYSRVVPQELRHHFGNFLHYLATPVRLVNTVLQGRFKDAGAELSRFGINTTLGVFGFADVAAKEYEIMPVQADFGQTLGSYGIGEGVYLYWPVLGPSNLRDTVGLVGDMVLQPPYYIDMSTSGTIVYKTFEKVNDLSISPDLYGDLIEYSLDPYSAVRQSFHDYRENKIKKVIEARGIH